MGVGGFLHAAERDPEGFLSLAPFSRFVAGGGRLPPGSLLDARLGEAPRAVPAPDLIQSLARQAAQFAHGPADCELGVDTDD
jgi:hypothetical protein